MDPVADFEVTLQPLAAQMDAWLQRDIIGAAVFMVVSFVVGVLSVSVHGKFGVGKWTKIYTVISALVLGAGLFFGVVLQAASQRAQIDAYVSQQVGERPNQGP